MEDRNYWDLWRPRTWDALAAENDFLSNPPRFAYDPWSRRGMKRAREETHPPVRPRTAGPPRGFSSQPGGPGPYKGKGMSKGKSSHYFYW